MPQAGDRHLPGRPGFRRAPEGARHDVRSAATRTSTSASSGRRARRATRPPGSRCRPTSTPTRDVLRRQARGAVDAAACHKPQERHVSGRPRHDGALQGRHGLRDLPQGSAHGTARELTCERCHTPDAWRIGVAGVPQVGRVPARRAPSRGPVRLLSRQRRDQGHANALLRLPLDPPAGRPVPDPARRPLRELPPAGQLDGGAWNHGAVAGVPLSAAHRTLGCEAATRPAFQAGQVPATGATRRSIRRRVAAHQSAGFPTQCDAVPPPSHSSWTQAVFKHKSYFPLAGLHATQACATCHKNNVYKGTSARLRRLPPRQLRQDDEPGPRRRRVPDDVRVVPPLHRSDVERVVQPREHLYAGRRTRHAGVHRVPQEQRLQGHVPRLRRVSPHRLRPHDEPGPCGGGLPDDVRVVPPAGVPSFSTTAGFNHTSVFTLAGLHATQACTACHKNNVYKGTPRDCVGCHRTDYDRTTNPNHAAAGFATTCDSCHKASDTAWRANVSHATFALVGTHATQACAACHKNSVYKGTPRDCVGCHRTNYDRTTNPNHAAAGFPTTCESCHQPTAASWSSVLQPRRLLPAGRRARHAGLQRVPQEQRLQGHAARLRRLPPRRLRQDDQPEPRGGRLPDDVRLVPPGHATRRGVRRSTTPASSRWSAGTRRRPAPPATRTTSTRARRATASAATARTTTGRRTRTTRRPASRPRASRATSRRRRRGRTTFNHSSIFPLVGVHATQACAACHKNNVYKGTPRDCVGCHRADYEQTTNPNHAAAGFPTTCESVPPGDVGLVERRRSTTRASTRWSASMPRRPAPPATRTTSTRARRATASAATAPTTSGRRTPTTRRPASRPRASRATSSHRRRGRRRSTTPASYALVGVHATQACTACHKNNVYKGTPRDCVGCHRAELRADRRTRTTRRPGSRRRASRATASRRLRGRRASTTAVLRARRTAPHGRLLVVPQEQRLQGHAAHVLPVPPGAVQRDDEPEPLGGRVPDHVRDVPQVHRHVVHPGHVQSHVVPDYVRQACGPRVQRVPPGPEQLQDVHVPDVPHEGDHGQSPPGSRGLPVRLGRVLLVPPERQWMIQRRRQRLCVAARCRHEHRH